MWWGDETMGTEGRGVSIYVSAVIAIRKMSVSLRTFDDGVISWAAHGMAQAVS